MKSKNILVLTSWSYKDALIQTYTLPHVRIIKKNIPTGSKIYLITYEQPHLSLTKDEIKQTVSDLRKENIYLITLKFSKFGIKAIIENILNLTKLLVLCYRKKISYIHAWCTPAAVTGYILSVITKTPLLIDGYEPHAEPSVENGNWKKNGLAFKILFFFEKLQAQRLYAAIATSSLMKEYAKAKYKVDLKRFFVKPAMIDFNQFNYAIAKTKNSVLVKENHLENKIVCVYAGKIGGIYLEKEIFDFLKVCYEYWGDSFRALLLTNTDKNEITRWASSSNLPPEIIITKFVYHKDIPAHIALGDFAFNPVKPIPSKKCCTSIKDGEYWAMGLPVVITDSLVDDCRIIKENGIGSILESLDEKSYLKAIHEIDSLFKNNSREELYKKIRPIAEKYRNFEIAEKVYENIYGKNSLL